MPTIMPVTELRNYGEVLREVAPGSPVFLTRNGRGVSELDRGRASAAGGTRTLEEARAHLAQLMGDSDGE